MTILKQNWARLLIAGLIILMQLPPFHDWDGHTYVVAVAIAFAAGDQLWSAYRGRGPFMLAVGLYTATVLVGHVMKEILDLSRGPMVALTVAAVFAAVGALVVVGIGVQRTRELDRRIIFESSTIALFATMVAAVTYASVESWLDVGPATGWLYAGVGLVSFTGAFGFLTRKYS